MKLISEGATYFEPPQAVERIVPEDHYALVDSEDILLMLGKRKEMVLGLATLMLPAGLESMTVTWAKAPYVDVNGTTVYL